MGEDVPDYIFHTSWWREVGGQKPDLILSPKSMSSMYLSGFDKPAFLKIPDARVDSLDAELISHGLQPNRWFCVINYRAPGYKHRPSRVNRDVDPKPFMALVEYIIDVLGGQVVRVGHPGMTVFPNRPGFVDLAMIENNFMLHAHAISRARFLIGGLTGISHLGSAVNTPTAITNCVDSPYVPGCWRDHDIVLFANLYDPGGRRVSIAERIEKNYVGVKTLFDMKNELGYSMAQNTFPELSMVTNALMEATMDCQTWRTPSYPSEQGRRPNKFEFPMPPKIRPQIMEI
jgi:putative glycosyltransferase (TIGR04372 family)